MKGAMKENFFGDIMKFINGSKEPFINLSDYNKKDKLFFFDMSLFLFISNKLNSVFKEKGQDKQEFTKNSPEKDWFKKNGINSWIEFVFFMKDWREKNNNTRSVIDMEEVSHIGLFKGYYDEFFLLYKKFPKILWITAMNNHKIENIDGTQYYFIDELEEITVLIAMNAWVRHLMDRHDRYFAELIDTEYNTGQDRFIDYIKDYVKNGLPENHDSILDYIGYSIFMSGVQYSNKFLSENKDLIGMKLDKYSNKLISKRLINVFKEYMCNMPKEDNPTRPREFIDKIKEIEHNVK